MISFSEPSVSEIDASSASEFTIEYRDASSVSLDTGHIQLLTTGTASCGFTLSSISDFVKTLRVSGCTGNGSLRVKVSSGSAISIKNISAPEAQSGLITVNATVDVAALYPTNGANWNDYVKNNGATPYVATDAACDGTEVGSYSACLHGGERRKVVVTGVTSCTGLTLVENLAAFEWKDCAVVSGVATFYTKGLKEEKGLVDLVDAAAWKDNYVSVYLNGTLIRQSVAGAWWSNTVQAYVGNTGTGTTLSSTGSIYTVATTTQTLTTVVAAHKIALVVFSGAQLESGGAGTTNFFDAADTGGNHYNYLWVEGKFVNLVPATLHALGNLTHATGSPGFHHMIRNFTAVDFNKGLLNASRSVFWNLSLSDKANYANANSQAISACQFFAYNLFYKIRISLFSYGIHQACGVPALGSNVFHQITYSNLGYGAVLGNDDVMTLFNSSSMSYASYLSHTDATFLGGTVTNGGEGFRIGGAGSTIYQIAGANLSSDFIVALNGSSAIKAGQLAMYSVRRVLMLDTNSNNTFTGVLVEDGNGCSVTAGTNPGADNTCAAQGASTWTVSSAADFTNSFVGKVAANDTENASDTNGAAAIAGITDWLNFESFFRFWGRDGSAFVNSDHRGTCDVGETCRIWDWRLDSADTMIRNTSNDGVTQNGAFTAGAACPTAVDGNKTVTDNAGRTFLYNAYEVLNDEIGDDNGLCQSNETCIYMPNFGSYQGHGNLLGACTFNDGTVTGVTMQAYDTNGI